MKSRREFVISQGWGTSSALRALGRIQLLRGGETRQVRETMFDVALDDSPITGDTDATRESADRS